MSNQIGRAAPYLLIGPSVLFMAVFFIWPLLNALLLAFQTPSGRWTLANIQSMLADLNFLPALLDTLLLLLFIVPIELAIALVAAVVIQKRPRGQGLLLYLWGIPLAVSDLAASLIWLSLFTYHGFLNSALQDLRLINSPIGFLDYDNFAGLVAAVVIAEVWRSISLVMIIILSGLQAIPGEVLEAAESLGAGGWRCFQHITLPLLRPTIQVALIMRTTAVLAIFASVLTLGGGTFHILAGESFHQVQNQNYSLAAAYGLLILFLSSMAVAGYLIFFRTPREVFK